MKSTRAVVLEKLRRVALALGDDLDRVVFVGGAAMALYDGPADEDLRDTKDIDCAVPANRHEYYQMLDRLRARGFRESREKGAPVCRHVLDGAIPVDIMPVDEAILGFTNRWYAVAVADAGRYALPRGPGVRAITPLCMLATKLEAFAARGAGDLYASRDLEDALLVLSFLPNALETIGRGGSAVLDYLRDELRRLLEETRLLESVVFHFSGDDAGQARARRLTIDLAAWLERTRGAQ